ncbi:DUF58 domain-containing protein [Marinobacter sp. CA1]|uniref:DUF58 domain-containing protein n=1 Tax=Marinobacter sp. CA1 TaxID=2817656 RepID=UPI001D08316C|nr:DUF58 domain-containing protein [Marinobacter sp. CA1]UDL03273.1 DUF58 domain-containing protein [Marinobacter sp. CA1]
MLLKSVRKRWQGWVNRRIPRSDTQQFVQNNIFILPTGVGVVFGLLLVVMLLTGINYQNSLIYLMTFILGVVFVAAMHQTHRNLSGLQLTLVQTGEGYAGDKIPFVFRGTRSKEATLALELRYHDQVLAQQHIQPGESQDMTLLARSSLRGYLVMDRVRVETRFPFGLLKAWSWIRPSTAAVVYPRPLLPPESPIAEGDDGEADARITSDGQDHVDIRPWRQGDLSQRVLWKRYARTGDMVIAEWSGQQGRPDWLDYDAFPGVEQELRLSYLTALVQQKLGADEAFGLKLPGEFIAPDTGPAHGARCLRALAVFGQHDPAAQGAERRGATS